MASESFDDTEEREILRRRLAAVTRRARRVAMPDNSWIKNKSGEEVTEESQRGPEAGSFRRRIRPDSSWINRASQDTREEVSRGHRDSRCLRRSEPMGEEQQRYQVVAFSRDGIGAQACYSLAKEDSGVSASNQGNLCSSSVVGVSLRRLGGVRAESDSSLSEDFLGFEKLTRGTNQRSSRNLATCSSHREGRICENRSLNSTCGGVLSQVPSPGGGNDESQYASTNATVQSAVVSSECMYSTSVCQELSSHRPTWRSASLLFPWQRGRLRGNFRFSWDFSECGGQETKVGDDVASPLGSKTMNRIGNSVVKVETIPLCFLNELSGEEVDLSLRSLSFVGRGLHATSGSSEATRGARKRRRKRWWNRHCVIHRNLPVNIVRRKFEISYPRCRQRSPKRRFFSEIRIFVFSTYVLNVLLPSVLSSFIGV